MGMNEVVKNAWFQELEAVVDQLTLTISKSTQQSTLKSSSSTGAGRQAPNRRCLYQA